MNTICLVLLLGLLTCFVINVKSLECQRSNEFSKKQGLSGGFTLGCSLRGFTIKLLTGIYDNKKIPMAKLACKYMTLCESYDAIIKSDEGKHGYELAPKKGYGSKKIFVDLINFVASTNFICGLNVDDIEAGFEILNRRFSKTEKFEDADKLTQENLCHNIVEVIAELKTEYSITLGKEYGSNDVIVHKSELTDRPTRKVVKRNYLDGITEEEFNSLLEAEFSKHIQGNSILDNKIRNKVVSENGKRTIRNDEDIKKIKQQIDELKHRMKEAEIVLVELQDKESSIQIDLKNLQQSVIILDKMKPENKDQLVDLYKKIENLKYDLNAVKSNEGLKRQIIYDMENLLNEKIDSQNRMFSDKIKYMVNLEKHRLQADLTEMIHKVDLKGLAIWKHEIESKISKFEDSLSKTLDSKKFVDEYIESKQLDCADDTVRRLKPCTCISTSKTNCTKEFDEQFGVYLIRMKCENSGKTFTEVDFMDFLNKPKSDCWNKIKEEMDKNKLETLQKHRKMFVNWDKQGQPEIKPCVQMCHGDYSKVKESSMHDGVLLGSYGVSCLCVPSLSKCKIDISSHPKLVSINLIADEGSYIVKAKSGFSKAGSFDSFKTIEMPHDGPSEGVIKVECNGNTIEKHYSWDLRDYCTNLYGGFRVMQWIYCMNSKQVYWICVSLIILMIIKIFKDLLIQLTSMVVFFPFLILFYFGFNKFKCPDCHKLCLNLCRFHRCNNVCMYCHKYIIQGLEKDDINSELDKLSLSKKHHVHRRTDCKLYSAYNNMESNLKNIVSWTLGFSQQFVGLIVGIIMPSASIFIILFFLTQVKISVAGKTDSVSLNRQLLNITGSTEFSRDMQLEITKLMSNLDIDGEMFHLSQYSVTTESTNAEVAVICGKNDCQNQLKIEGIIDFYSGQTIAYKTKIYDNSDKRGGKDMFFKVKVITAHLDCEYSNSYLTGQVDMKTATGDTCTEDCDACIGYLYKPKTNSIIFNQTKPQSSSWACDGFGCASIGSGCTCGKCWCELNQHNKYQVKELVKEIEGVVVCFEFFGKSKCREFKTDEVKEEFKLIRLTKPNVSCPKRIACSLDKGECFEGEINKAMKFDSAFGSVQQDSGGHVYYRRNEDYFERCHAFGHRAFIYKSCCYDTYFMKSTLKSSSLIQTDLKETMRLDHLSDFGKWKLYVKLPDIRVKLEEQKNTLKDLEFISCMGCFGCSNGANCYFKIDSKYSNTEDVSITECKTNILKVPISAGLNNISLPVFCNSEINNITLIIGDEKLSLTFMARLKPKNEIPGFYSRVMYTSKVENDGGCGWIFCTFHFFGFKKYVYIFVFLLVILILSFLIKPMLYTLLYCFKLFKFKRSLRNNSDKKKLSESQTLSWRSLEERDQARSKYDM